MISNFTQESWDVKVIELGSSILQSWAWGEFQQAVGNKIYRLSSSSFVSLVIELTLPFGKKYLYCPRGPLGKPEDVLADIKHLAQLDHSIIFARLEPDLEMSLPKAAKEVQPMYNWMLSLDKTEEQLLIGMKPKTRYNIHLASRKRVVVREGGKEDLLTLWKLMLESAVLHKFHLHPQNYYWQMWEALAPKYLKLLIAEYHGKPLSAMILTLFGPTASYLHGGSSSQMKEAMAPYLLHWEAIRLTKQLGLTTYDFGGIASSDSRSHSWAGISRFKKGFGGFEVTYPGSYDLVFSPIWYNVYRNVRVLRKLLRQSLRIYE